jgi:hypothetical protein
LEEARNGFGTLYMRGIDFCTIDLNEWMELIDHTGMLSNDAVYNKPLICHAFIWFLLSWICVVSKWVGGHGHWWYLIGRSALFSVVILVACKKTYAL